MTKRKLGFQDRWMFNRVLCEKDVCRKILRAALGIEAGEISYLNAEQCFEPLAAGRGVRLDVFARGDGRVYDIEMQVARERGLGRRMRYYQAAMDVGELGSGEGLLPPMYFPPFTPMIHNRSRQPAPAGYANVFPPLSAPPSNLSRNARASRARALSEPG